MLIAISALIPALAAAQPIRPDVSPAIIRHLKATLRPSDLRLPVAKLRASLNAIGANAEVPFQVTSDVVAPDQPEPVISRVQGSATEAFAVLEPTGEESPSLAYWIGLLHGKVSARAIPVNSDPMVGAVYATWRRRGKYLVGVGLDNYFHSPKWDDGEFYVFVDSPAGPKMIQRHHADSPDEPCGFLDKSSLTLRLDGIWKFRNGQYVHVGPLTRR